jgi:hypothetical protein
MIPPPSLTDAGLTRPRTTVRVKKESDTAPSAVPQAIESHLQTKQAAVSASKRLREFEDIRPLEIKRDKSKRDRPLKNRSKDESRRFTHGPGNLGAVV